MPSTVLPPAEAVIRRALSTARDEARDAFDRFLASDPGLSRLRHGLRAVVTLASAIVVQTVVAVGLGVPRGEGLLHVMLGAVVALNLATTMKETRRRPIAGTALAAAGGAAVGAGSAVVAAPWPAASIPIFVLVTFAAVWMRRFGPRWFSTGFVMWQAYFFALFLHPPVSALPGMLLAVVISAAWVGFLLANVLTADPEATLHRTVTALRAQARGVVSAAIDLVDRPSSPALEHELRKQVRKTSEVALLFDGQLGDARALPDGVSAVRLREWIIDLEIAVDEVAGAVLDLVGQTHPAARATTMSEVRRALVELGWSRYDEARFAVGRLRQDPHCDAGPVRRFTAGATQLLDTVADWTSGRVLEQARHESDPEAFAPVVVLQGGNLPGSQELAGKAVAAPVGDTAHWWSAGRLRFTTRQAIQAAAAVALAILAGRLISPERFYWAAIAAFVTFTGASTTAETARKAIDRTVGTMLGLVAAVGLAHVTSGHTVLVAALLLLGVFLAFYVQALSTTWMIFFLTLVLGQLYEMLRTYSEDLLLLRLAETAAGAAAGVIVTYAVLPAPARDTLVVARGALLESVTELVDRVGVLLSPERVDGPSERAELYANVLQMEEAARQVVTAHDSLIRPRIFDADHAARRHRIATLRVCAASARALAAAALATTQPVPPAASAVCRLLAEEARRLVRVPDLRDQRPAPADRPGLTTRVAELLAGAGAASESGAVSGAGIPVDVVRPAQRLAEALALLTPKRR
ncbi:MAG: FUSC family protein [Tetrasphaera sp.]